MMVKNRKNLFKDYYGTWLHPFGVGINCSPRLPVPLVAGRDGELAIKKNMDSQVAEHPPC